MEEGTMLNMSEVVFNEEEHSYYRGEERLSGITSLIHDVLRLGVYPDADPRTEQIFIPRAGYHGSCVHHAIQTLETLGIEETQFPAVEHETQDFGTVIFPEQDVQPELDSYKQFLIEHSLHCVASEHTVDYGQFASQIDAVDEDIVCADIYLVDYKTNNIDAYPGGKEGLKAYLSWQMSCYAFMFERQNPGRKVKGLIGLWLKGDKWEAWVIERQPDEKVKCLLETTVLPSDNGFIYLNPEMQVEETVEVVATPNDLAIGQDFIGEVVKILEYEAKAKELKEQLRAMMEKNGVSKFECDLFSASIGKPSTREDFDKSAFKEVHPELYKEYTKTTNVKSRFTLTLKKDKQNT